MSSEEALNTFPLVFSRLDGTISTTPMILEYRHPNVGDYVSTQLFSIHRSAFINVLDDKSTTKESVTSILDGSAQQSKLSAEDVDSLAHSLAENYKHVRIMFLICSVLFTDMFARNRVKVKSTCKTWIACI